MFGAESYGDQLRALLPKGRAWAAEPDSTLGRLLDGIGAEFARIDARAEQLIGEADPRSTLELLTDWERVAGLPDPCFGMPDNLPERQVAVVSRITSVGGQSRAYFTQLAASLGYVVSITEFRPARCGDRMGARTYGTDWVHVWRMNILPTDYDTPADQLYVTQARCGDRCGTRIRGWGAINLECLIRRHAPAHSIVFFGYQIEPDPLFWFDFTA